MLRRSSTSRWLTFAHDRKGSGADVTSMSLQICPGCQGRNAPQAAICDWCGRPFSGRAGGFTLRWWHLATGLLFGLVVLATAALVFLNVSRLDVRPRLAPAPSPVAETTALPTRAATAALVLP